MSGLKPNLTKRIVKGSPLTHAEGDNNLALIEQSFEGKADLDTETGKVKLSHLPVFCGILRTVTVKDQTDYEIEGLADAEVFMVIYGQNVIDEANYSIDGDTITIPAPDEIKKLIIFKIQ
jgi:hypothetical protein